MARYSFYSSPEYKEKQRQRSKTAWQLRQVNFTYKRVTRECLRTNCTKLFEILPSNPKKYCSSTCSAKVSNIKRGAQSLQTRKKISLKLTGKHSLYKGVIKVPRIEMFCKNPVCGKKFFKERWKKTRFCSVICAMHVIGGHPTSPRAARAKAGVRKDIGSKIYFYSRWEANLARLFIYWGISWIHQPARFDLNGQNYTPDFYLPEYDAYIEVKNFLGAYSKERDEKFRKFYPNIHLKLLLKKEYLELEKMYSKLIPNWEYKNSKFEKI